MSWSNLKLRVVIVQETFKYQIVHTKKEKKENSLGFGFMTSEKISNYTQVTLSSKISY